MTSALRIGSGHTVDDVAQFGRRVRDLAADGTTQLVKRADVPHLVETGRDSAATAVSGAMDGAAAAVSDAVDRVSGRRRRRRANSLKAVVAVAILMALGLGAWWVARSGSLAALRGIGDDREDLEGDSGAAADQALDAEALSRATGEGMGGSDWASGEPAVIPAAPEGGPAEAADRVGELVHSGAGPA